MLPKIGGLGHRGYGAMTRAGLEKDLARTVSLVENAEDLVVRKEL